MNKELKKQYRTEMRLFGHKPSAGASTGPDTAIGRCECCSTEARFKKNADGWHVRYFSNATLSSSGYGEYEPDPCKSTPAKKFDVGYIDTYRRESNVHIFAISEGHARYLVEKNGVGWENNGRVFVEVIKHVRLAA